MKHTKLYSRTIRFAYLGLNTAPPLLTVNVRVADEGRGPCQVGPDLHTQIERYARGYLAHAGSMKVHAHPDTRHGYITDRQLNGADGVTLAEFTVHHIDEEQPAPQADLDDVAMLVETVVPDPANLLGVASHLGGVIVSVHCEYTHAVRDVLTEVGYQVRAVSGFLLVTRA